MDPFHLAIPVKDLSETKDFYEEILGLEQGRSSDKWVDFNFFGHQLVLHRVDEEFTLPTNEVDAKIIPVLHFGLVMQKSNWDSLTLRLHSKKIPFLIAPNLRFQDTPGEQWTFFIQDPSGNALEFKSMTRAENLFTA